MNDKGKYFVKGVRANVVLQLTSMEKNPMLCGIVRFRIFLFFFFLKDRYLKQVGMDSSN